MTYFQHFPSTTIIKWYLYSRIDDKFSTPSNLPGERFVINLRETQTYVKFVTFSNDQRYDKFPHYRIQLMTHFQPLPIRPGKDLLLIMRVGNEYWQVEDFTNLW